ncbi:MAG: hypothetical protein JWP01_3350 [Myxococcales bacterium]|nr:hypothetical protein [Myxococcales bacterium]
MLVLKIGEHAQEFAPKRRRSPLVRHAAITDSRSSATGSSSVIGGFSQDFVPVRCGTRRLIELSALTLDTVRAGGSIAEAVHGWQSRRGPREDACSLLDRQIV